MTAAAQFLRLLFLTKPKFRSVECPCLIFQAQDDDTVHRKSADFILDSVCGDKQIIRLASGGHTVLLSDSIGRIAPSVLEFIESGEGNANSYHESSIASENNWMYSEVCNAHSL